MDFPYWEMMIAVSASKFLVIFNINPTQQVNQLEEGSEVQTNIVVNANTVKIFQRMDRSIYSVNPCMGQLVHLSASSICNRHIRITRSCRQEDFLGLAIDRHDDIDI